MHPDPNKHNSGPFFISVIVRNTIKEVIPSNWLN